MSSEGEKKIGNKIKIITIIGSGSYGVVSKCQDEYGNLMAIKKVPLMVADRSMKIVPIKDVRNGIQNVLELLLMGSKNLDCPYLAKSLKIHADSNNVHILQPLSVTTLARVKTIPPLFLKGILLSLSLAVKALHDYGIIHGDIKASNILLFEDWTIRLTDYGFSVPIDEYDHKGGTSSHRAPECTGIWSVPSDIWSLGCTFYEVAFRCNLFSSSDASILHKEWSSIYPCEKLSSGRTNKSDTKYIERSDNFCSDTSDKLLDDLIIRTLHPDPSLRYDINDVLRHEYFTGYTLPKMSKSNLPWTKVSLLCKDRIMVDSTIANENARKIASWILWKTRDLRWISQSLKRYISCVIASKITRKDITLDDSWSPSQKREAEMMILKHLNFSLD